MAILEFDCPSCKHHYKVPMSAAGRKAKCKSCGGAMQVPQVGSPVDEKIELKPVTPARRGSAKKPSAAKRPAAPSAPRKKEAEDPLAALAALADDDDDDVPVATMDFESSRNATRNGRSGSGRRKSKKGMSGIPMPLLISGISGSALVVILAVVLIVVFSGSEDEEENTNPGNTAGIASTASSPNTYTPGGSVNTPKPAEQDADKDEADQDVDETESDTPSTLSDLPMPIRHPGKDQKLSDWTIDVEKSVAEAARQIPRGGIMFIAPTSWESKSKPTGEESGLIKDVIAVSPDESISLHVHIGKHSGNTAPDWPMLLTGESAPSDYSSAELVNGKSKSNSGGKDFMLVKDQVVSEAEFGTLLGGYRFTRFAMKDPRPAQAGVEVVHYVGSIGNLFVHISIRGENADAAKMAEAEWIARSARLMTEQGMQEYGRRNVLFSDWMKEPGTTIPRKGDVPPVTNTEAVAWDGFSDDSEFKQMLAMAGAAGPIRSAYRVAPADGLELAATSRLAVRWQPNDNGLWMGLEIRDLGSRWRRVETPMVSEGRAMIAGREMQLPEGTERGQFEANGMTVYRFLMPANPHMDSREVYYVTVDRGVLVTVLGRYAKDRPDDLKLLDSAARTLNKS